MSVKLISYTQPAKDLFDADIKSKALELVAYCARVSNPGNQNNSETSEKLVRYLIKNQHWSPLEMVSICLEINTTRDIARQILRHRSFSFQEFSQRYADPTKEFAFELRDARLQDPKNRQNSIAFDDSDLKEAWWMRQSMVLDSVRDSYAWALENGIAKEQARAILPEGLTMSRIYMNGTLRSWAHYIELRSGNGTQKEHKDIAVACAEVIEPIFPMIKEFVSE